MQKAPNLVIDVSKCSSFCKSDGQMREKTRYSTKKPPWRLLGSQMAPWRPLGGPWAPKFFWVIFGTHLGTLFGSKNHPKLCRNSVENRAPVLDAIFGQLEASWSRFGVDLESILGCFFDPQPTAFHQTAPISSTNYF